MTSCPRFLSRPTCVVCLTFLVALPPARGLAQGTADDRLAEVKAQYTKYEYRIPMRDGKRLFTAVYVPKDQSQTFPILLTRTPYSAKPYGADQYRDVGGWKNLGSKLGDVPFNAKTGDYFREHIELPFFEYYLKDKGKLEHPEAWMFETGTNVWRKYDAWPPKKAKARAFYFHAGGKLTVDQPADAKSDEVYDEYPSDPARPVPYFEKITIGMSSDFKTADQRFASRRPDVLVYATDVLDEDVTIAGPVDARLFVATTGTDADWVVKLIDVYPDDYPDPNPNPAGVKMGGYQQLVRGDVMRGKFRSSYEKPEAFTPGKPTPVKFSLQDTCHTFRSGHRIMIQVQSSWFPLVDRNPQTFVDIYTAKDSDFQKATQRVYRTREMPSSVSLLVVAP